MEVRVSKGSPQGWGHWQHRAGKVRLGVNPLGIHHQPHHKAWRPQGWVASGQTTSRKGMQPHPSAENWIKALLSKALPTRARPSFSHHQSLPSGNLHKPLSQLHQRADRRSKKNHNPTAARTKTTLQKVNQYEKAESYVPDEGTR